jgi:hypothetical protein
MSRHSSSPRYMSCLVLAGCLACARIGQGPVDAAAPTADTMAALQALAMALQADDLRQDSLHRELCRTDSVLCRESPQAAAPEVWHLHANDKVARSLAALRGVRVVDSANDSLVLCPWVADTGTPGTGMSVSVRLQFRGRNTAELTLSQMCIVPLGSVLELHFSNADYRLRRKGNRWSVRLIRIRVS